MNAPYRDKPVVEWWFTWETGGELNPPKGPGWEMHSWQIAPDGWTVPNGKLPSGFVAVLAVVLWRRET
jgi:hypothetical protein